MRFATIGSNFIVDRFVEAGMQCADFSLHAVYSRSAAQAEANQRKWGASTAYADIGALAGDSSVEAVYIASPNLFHSDQCRKMLEAGKHVLCEKPIVVNEALLSSLLRTAEMHGVLLLEAMRPAYLPAIQIIRDLIPGLGALRYCDFPYCQYSSRYDRVLAGAPENAFDPTLCNGALMDIGVYCVHWMLMLLGEPARVTARASFLQHSIDITGVAVCDYSGMQAVLSYSKAHQSNRPCVIEGEKASLRIQPFPIPQSVERIDRDGSVKTISLDTPPKDMACEIKAFMEFAQNPARAKPFQQLSLQALRVMDRIRLDSGIDFSRR